MSHNKMSSFVKSILTQSSDFESIKIETLRSVLLESRLDVSLTTKLAVMMMIFEYTNGSIESKINCINEQFCKILDIIFEHKLLLPEEECIIEKILKDLNEDGEGVIAPTNSVSGIEPTVPRIVTKKKKIEEDNDAVSRD